MRLRICFWGDGLGLLLFLNEDCDVIRVKNYCIRRIVVVFKKSFLKFKNYLFVFY